MRRMYSDKQVLKTVEEVAQTEGLKVFENIVDKDGHPRFIEGDITIEATAGFTQSYGKWSLSGTHLMLVVAGSIENSTTWVGGKTLYEVELPQWLLDKIIPAGSQRIENKNYSIFSIDASSAQNISTYFSKLNGKLALTLGGLTTDAKRYFRFTSDLLIDNE